MKWLVVITLLAVFLHTSNCHSDDLCIPVRRDAQDPTPSPVVMQGRPGKIGPPGVPGVKGPRGLQGVQGIAGQCFCDWSQIESKIQELNRAIEKLNKIAKTSHREQFCSAGVKDRRVKDEDMSASSAHLNGDAHFGRLDNSRVWHAASGHFKPGEWLQVDFKTPIRIFGVITQGRVPGDTYDDRVTSYKIAYGNSTNSLQTIQNSTRADMIFQGNRDRNTHVTNIFPEPVTARYFRIVVVTFVRVPVLRIEYLLC